MAGGGRLRRKTITSPDPSDTGDIINTLWHITNKIVNSILYHKDYAHGSWFVLVCFRSTSAIAFTWWRHQMETFSALLAICAGNSPVQVNSPHKGQWRGALIFSLICVWINGWVNNRKAGDLRRHRAHYVVIVMRITSLILPTPIVLYRQTNNSNPKKFHYSDDTASQIIVNSTVDPIACSGQQQRKQMFTLLSLFEGNSLVTSAFPTQGQ